MTKVLKYLFLILLLLSVISCGDDDKDEPKDETNYGQKTIVGKWQCKYDAYGDLWFEPLIFLFDEDGTGYEWFSDEPFSEREEFTYTYTSSRLVVRTGWTNYDLRYEISSNGKSLVIYGWDDDNMSELHFTRMN